MRPPRLAGWLLERMLDRERAEAILGDLTEGYRRRAPGSVRRARLWFWRQALASIAVAQAARWRRGPVVADHAGSAGRVGVLSGLSQDLRFAFRSLRRAPAFAVAAILTLAIGIGASTAIGTAANRVLLRPLPYPEGKRLVFLGHPNEDGSVGNVGFQTVVDWRARMSTFDQLSIIRGWSPTFVGPEGAAPLGGMRVNWNFFQMIGVRPAMGRDFAAGDDDPDHWRVLIISDGLWRRQFHARPDIVGVTIEFSGRPYQIVGVLPASFDPLLVQHFFGRAEIWAPLGYNPTGDSSCRSCQHLRLLGRLREGMTLAQAKTQAAAVHADLRREYPGDYREAPPAALMLQDEIARPIRRSLQILLGAVLFVLLVASTNVAGLLLARAADRDHEFALRAALGAGWGRLVRQLATESLLLAVAAALLGVGLAKVGLLALAEYAPSSLPRLDQAPADPALIVLAVLSTAVALFTFGLLPALTTSRPSLESVLRTVRQSPARRSLRVREWLIAAQVAIALLLVAGAGLMHRTVDRLLQVNPGFDAGDVFTAGMSLVGPAWAENPAVRTFQDDLLARVRALPGVEHAALAAQIPLGGNYDRRGFHIEGRTYATEAEAPDLERYSVTPDYFNVLRIPLKQGRWLTDADVTDGALVLLVNETAAQKLWPGGTPLGARVRIGANSGPYRTIVGVVGDVRHYALGEPASPQFYLPQRQDTDSYLTLVARTTNNAAALAQPVRTTIASIARDVPVYGIVTLEELLDRSVASRSFLMFLLGLFAATTVAMAAVGLYGTVSQAVSARHREFGIRLALGAGRRDISWLAMRRGFWFVAGGVAVGLAASTMCGQLLRGQLYGTTPADPAILAGSAAALFLVALGAHLWPVRRALRVDPAVTLRND